MITMLQTKSLLSVIPFIIFSLAFISTLSFPFYSHAVGESYVITYNANGATSGSAPANQIKTEGIDLTLSTNNGALTRTGYIFAGWNTEPDGTGISYMAGKTYTTDADINLFALWAENSCTGMVYDSYENEYGMVTSGNQCWLDRNLGASRVAQSYDDAASYGYYYQWGRGSDGHELAVNGVPTSGTTEFSADSDTPGHNLFIASGNEGGTKPDDWRDPQNDNLWHGVNGVNNVCPAGWRLPTSFEFSTMVAQEGIDATSAQGLASAFNSVLKIPAAGHRQNTGVYYQGERGFYYSASPSFTQAAFLDIKPSSVNPFGSTNRRYGQSVRCIRETHVVTTSTGSNGTVSPLVRSVSHGTNTNFTVTPVEGYSANLTGCDGTLSGSTYTTGAITADCTVSATFSLNTYDITTEVSPKDSGTVSCTANPVEHNHDSICTASPAEGYTFSGWSGDCTGGTCTLVNVTSDKSATANFTPNTYTVTASAGANGTISPTAQVVNHGEATTFTVTPSTRYRASVTGCDGSLDGTTYTTGAITADCAVSANFTRSSSGGGGGSSAPKDKTSPINKPTIPEKPSTPAKNKPSDTGVPTTSPSLSSGVSVTTLINLFVSLGIIPAEKATLARTFVAEKIGTPTKPTLPSTFRFTTTLKQGDTHPEVQHLQQFLNARGFTVAQTGAGSAGQETDYFGPATRAALIRFQEAYRADILTTAGFNAPTGIFGSNSLNMANSILPKTSVVNTWASNVANY